MEIDSKTGEILVSASNRTDYDLIKQSKIQAYKLLSPNDFVSINGVWEAKRDALIKILSSLPISYSWELKDRHLSEKYSQVLGTLSIETGKIPRQADSMGICEYSELKGNGGLHFMNARAETRALKRAIETLFGSVINYYARKPEECLMSHHQYKLFEYTKANDLLIGDDVIEVVGTKCKIKALQSQKILTPNWRLDIIFRDLNVIGKVFVMRLERVGTLTDQQRYAIVIEIEPKCIKGYDIPIAFFEFKKDAEAVLEIVQAYLKLRYGV